MAKSGKTKSFEKLKDPGIHLVAMLGGATHRTAEAAQGSRTTNQGVVAADNQNILKSGQRGLSFLAAKLRRVLAREARLLESCA
jgi:hypothetical protein